MSKSEKGAEIVPKPAAPSAKLVKIEGVEEAEKYQAENPSHRLVRAYRPSHMAPKVFEYAEE